LRFDSGRLDDLENKILGVEREGDLPGEMIPYVYFEYLRSREAWRVAPILHHNVMDIVTLACLTGIVPWAFHSPDEARVTHGAEMIGLARWFQQAEQYDRARDLFRRGIECHLRDEVLFPAMWSLANLEKKLGHTEAALAAFTDLAASPNSHRADAYEELAKYYEHQEKNYAMALEMTRAARGLTDSEALRKRERRLQHRAAQPKPRRLL
jgi:tetratricopeptide (TPR) repeat protein